MISKYPIEISDQEGIADAVNYLLSGPAGLGQNFGGISAYDAAIIRPTFFRPFTLPYTTTLDASWYIRMPVTAITPNPSNPTDKITVTFTPPLAYTNPPFQFGDRLKLRGFEDSGLPTGFNSALDTPTGTKATLAQGQQFGPVATTTVTGVGYGAKIFVILDAGATEPYSSSNTDTFVDIQNVGTDYAIGDTIKVLGTALGGTSPANDLTLTVTAVDAGFYNDNYNVYSSTTTTVDLYTSKQYFWPNITTYGEVLRDYSNYPISTDCLSQVKINSAQDRVFITAQVEFSYTINFETIPPLPAYYTENTWDIVVQVNRYTASLDAQGNTVFNFQDTVSQKILSSFYGDPAGQKGSAIFTTIIDQQLQFGSYAYILELAFVTKPTLGDGTTPGLAGFGTTPGWLIDNGFRTAPLPRGVAVGNLQVQSDPPGTTYTNIVPTIISSQSGTNSKVDVTVNPDILTPLYTVGKTVDIALSTTSSSFNTGFVPGDILKISGTDLGGSSPLNDLYLAVTETSLRSDVIPGKFTMGLRDLSTQVIKN